MATPSNIHNIYLVLDLSYGGQKKTDSQPNPSRPVIAKGWLKDVR